MNEQALFTLDLDRCTGCGACVVACNTENGVEPQLSWRHLYTFNEPRFPWAPVLHYSLACNHCARPACLAGCPAKAYRKDARTGAVLLDPERCIGCRYCSWVCPYDAPRFDTANGVMTKCTFCQHRLERDERPACVVACPVDALGFEARGIPAEQDRPGFPATGLGPAIRLGGRRPREAPRAVSFADETERPAAAPAVAAARLRGEWSLLVFTFLMTLLVSRFAVGQLLGHPAPLWELVVLGGCAGGTSLLHLGRPERAWRAMLHFRRSWLSREAVFSAAFVATCVTAIVWPGTGGGRALGWIATALGGAALISMDFVYRVPGQRVRTLPHSAMTTLTALFLIGVGLGRPLLALVAGAVKLLLYLQRWSAVGFAGRVAALRLGLGFGVPIFGLVLGPAAEGPFVLGWLGLAGLLVGEAIDRTQFYAELDFLGPRRQIERDLERIRETSAVRVVPDTPGRALPAPGILPLGAKGSGPGLNGAGRPDV